MSFTGRAATCVGLLSETVDDRSSGHDATGSQIIPRSVGAVEVSHSKTVGAFQKEAPYGGIAPSR